MADLGASLARGVTFAPLCLDALSARIAEDAGFDFGYLSGGALGYSHAVSEALLTLSELADAARHITARSHIGLIVDAGVGFGDAVHVARTVAELEAAGAVALEIEDQVAPKRVSHHRGIEHLVSVEEMAGKIEQAAAARLAACRQAGADVLMLMGDDDAYRQAAGGLDAPLATIASLDARPAATWAALGVSLVIDPFTAQVLAVEALRRAYRSFRNSGRTGSEPRDVMAAYRRLQDYAGLDRFYAIEDATTEVRGD